MSNTLEQSNSSNQPLSTDSSQTRYHANDFISTSVAALMAVMVSFAGPYFIIQQAAQLAHLNAVEFNSWLWAIFVGTGLCGVVLSWRYRLPIVCAWSSPGAALLVTALPQFSFAQAVGAYLISAILLLVLSMSGYLEKWMNRIPRALCAALLAGILFRFATDVFVQAALPHAGAAPLVGSIFISYLVCKRWIPRYAVALSLLIGISVYAITGWSAPAGTSQSTQLMFEFFVPKWTFPDWSWHALMSLALPLAVLSLTGQHMPGITVLRSSGYEPPVSPLVSFTSLVSAVGAFFGGHGVNLAAITASLCTGKDAHPDPRKRWIAGVICGVLYVLVGCFVTLLTSSASLIPHTLAIAISGLALLGAIQNNLVIAFADEKQREASLICFVVTVSNQTYLGLGAACWGLVLGGVAYAITSWRHRSAN